MDKTGHEWSLLFLIVCDPADMLILPKRNGEERMNALFCFRCLHFFYYVLLFFTKFYLRVRDSADRIILVEGCGKEREDTLFFQSYRFVQQRTVAYRGQG